MLGYLKSLPPVVRLMKRPPVIYSHARRTIQCVQNMNAGQREAFQAQRISAMLDIAKSLPGYIGKQGGACLADWPILEKAGLAGKEEFFSPRYLVTTPAATGGTTGKPLALRRSLSGVAFEQAHIDLLCERAGVDSRTSKIAVLRGDSIIDAAQSNPPFWRDQGRNKRVFSAHHLNPGTIDSYLAALMEFQPSILFCYPSSLHQLVHLAETRHDAAQVRIPLIFASSEVLDETCLQRAQRVFNSVVLDYYGHAERVVSAHSGGGGEFWFDPAYGHVELLPCGNNQAEIIATSLWTHGQIFIRYRTGDIARIESTDPSYLRNVALGILPFAGIEGRSNEYIDLQDGRRIIGLNHIPRGVTGIESLQLHCTGNIIHVYITPSKSYGAKTVDEIMRNMAMKFPPGIGTRLFLVNRPLREPNGKAPLLLRNPELSQTTPIETGHLSHMEPV